MEFNRYTLYVDSTHTSTNFKTLQDVKEHTANMMGVKPDQVVFEKDITIDGYTNISVKDKFGDQIRVIGFVYGKVI